MKKIKINKPLGEERESIKETAGAKEGMVQWMLEVSTYVKEPPTWKSNKKKGDSSFFLAKAS